MSDPRTVHERIESLEDDVKKVLKHLFGEGEDVAKDVEEVKSDAETSADLLKNPPGE